MTLAVHLENAERHINRFAKNRRGMFDNVTSSDIGSHKKHVMDLITAYYPSFDLKEILSVQPLKQKNGALYFLDYQYVNDKGEVSSGDKFFGANQSPKRTGFYSSQEVRNEPLDCTFDTDHIDFQLKYWPVIVEDFKMELTVNGGPVVFTYDAEAGQFQEV